MFGHVWPDKHFDKTLLHKCLNNDALEDSVLQCANSIEGNWLEHVVGEFTPADHTFIPWIVVDGKYDKTVADAIVADMVGYLCKDRPDVPGCQSSSAAPAGFLVDELTVLAYGGN
jgi:hypothetical protein